MDFGELRGAVQASLQDRRLIGEVIWCILMSERREEALYYASNALAVRSYGSVNLGELVQFVVDGEQGIVQAMHERYRCDATLRYEFLCAWALSVVHKPTDSPALSMDSQGRPLIMAWNHNNWEMRFDEVPNQPIIDRVDWSVWKGLAKHLKVLSARR